jgi:hypothetical protein
MANPPISPWLDRWAFLIEASQSSRDASDVDQKRLTCRRERDSFAPSLEQINFKLAFEVVNLLAERRLRNMQTISGMGKVQLLGGSDEVF